MAAYVIFQDSDFPFFHRTNFFPVVVVEIQRFQTGLVPVGTSNQKEDEEGSSIPLARKYEERTKFFFC